MFSLPLEIFKSPTSFVIETNNGNPLSASIAKDGKWQFPVADSVPIKFKDCIIAFEDKRFYEHFGVDFFALSRAMKQNIKAKSIVSGGSTLTMQVVRLSRKQDRTIS